VFVQVSVSSTKLSDIKIDPLRGQKSKYLEETSQETAAREVFEESSHLFDLRTSELSDCALPKTGDDSGMIYHISIRFDEDLSITPFKLVQEYRKNRRILMEKCGYENKRMVEEYRDIGGFFEVLDLAVEPITRKDCPKIYPRLASQTVATVKELYRMLPGGNLGVLPTVCLHRHTSDGLISYSISKDSSTRRIEMIVSDEQKIWHPILTNCQKWELWLRGHDNERRLNREAKCTVSQDNPNFRFTTIRNKGNRNR
jgi:hypothetical protein